MGSINDKLNYLEETKNYSKQQLNNLGAGITNETTFRNYLTWPNNFYNNISNKTDLATNGMVGRTSQDTTIGKNIFHFKAAPSSLSGGVTTSYNEKTGEIICTGSSNRDYPWLARNNITIPSGTTMTVSLKEAKSYGVSFRLYYDANNYETASISANTLSKTFTTSHDIIVYGVLLSRMAEVEINDSFYIQIEEGSTATDFEPFTFGASPNPDYPQSINNLTGNVAYKVSGKNLWEFNGMTFDNWGIPDNDMKNFFNSLSNGTYTFTLKAKIKTLTQETNGGRWGMYLENSSGSIEIRQTLNEDLSVGDIITNTIAITITDTNKGKFTRAYKYTITEMTNYTPCGTIELFETQLEQGSTATSYEPYMSQTFNIPLGDIELCKIDTYEDKIYSSNGRFYLNKKNGKYTFNSIVNAGLNTSGETSYQAQIGIIPTMKSSNWDYGYSNYFKRGTSKSNNIIRFGANDKYIYIYTNDSTFSITSSANTWISSHNIICYYILETPTTTEITQENYPSLYNVLKQIQDYLTAYKINKEFVLNYDEPNINY